MPVYYVAPDPTNIGLSLANYVDRSLTPTSIYVKWTCTLSWWPKMFVISILDIKFTEIESYNTSYFEDYSSNNSTLWQLFKDVVTPDTYYIISLLSISSNGQRDVFTFPVRTPPRPILTVISTSINSTMAIIEYSIGHWNESEFYLYMTARSCDLIVQKCSSLEKFLINISSPEIILRLPTVGTEYSFDFYLLDFNDVHVSVLIYQHSSRGSTGESEQWFYVTI